MRVVFRGRATRRTKPSPLDEGDVLELLANDWDDFGFGTLFGVTCRVGEVSLDLDYLRLLVEDENPSRVKLQQLLSDGWDGNFPIPDTNYISVPSDISFYQQLEGVIGIERTIDVALALRDASYLVNVVRDEIAVALTQTTGFGRSLQRERGSIKAYFDGWRVLDNQHIAVLDLGFAFENVFGERSALDLKYQSSSPFPHDINVLIGPNGHGKSQVLHQMVRDWISPSDDTEFGFVRKPNLSRMVVVSYSPFEHFPVDLAGKRLKDVDAYKYFGFRGRRAPSEANRRGRIALSHEFPKRDAARSLLDCLSDDQKYQSIRDWANKVQTVEGVLRSAIDFDFATVEIPLARRARSLFAADTTVEPLSIMTGDDEERRQFLPIASDRIGVLDAAKVLDSLVEESGVTFFKDEEPIELSSGQRLFAYIVINILGAIKRNSLILVDEPELFLHPTLEVQFVGMLKRILKSFNSKALLATHSVVTVREVPADCVHVFDKGEDFLLVRHPPFQTFGGDIQRISSYVFGDSHVSKPFEDWITEQLAEFGSADELLAALGDGVNEELIVRIRATGRE
ncbi:AAA family ATPase [Rhodopseudomonas palustris]|uniref:ATPase AAA-type core domain-containing protein n=1 Tax=Rhodopseudomonas palustris (strain BisB18) TaxID=316056 RepID=Q21AL2_RHOPB